MLALIYISLSLLVSSMTGRRRGSYRKEASRDDPPLCMDDEMCVRSVGCLKLLEETNIVFGEETKVFDLVLEIGNTFNTHTEGIAFVFG